MRNARIGALLVVCAVLCAGAAWGADIERYKVSSIRYENDGAYAVLGVDIKWIVESGGAMVKCHMWNPGAGFIYNNQSRTYDLPEGGAGFKPSAENPAACGSQPEEGQEVWATIDIYNGNGGSCRKDETKFYYYPDGGTVKYKTGGTTMNNNRCKIASKPSTSF